MGIGDTIRNALIGGIGAAPINAALSRPKKPAADQGDFVRSTRPTVGTTSALDAAMQSHADEQHPVPARKPRMGAEWDQ